MKKIIIGIGILAAIIAVIALSGSSKEQQNGNNNADSSNVTLQDAHGLAVDRSDSSKVYIATHSGLLVLNNDTELQRVGTAQDDYMGFSAHPTNASTFYTSGHPSGGGNIGFQKSTDGGKSWQKISNGAGGPVDFHTMTVSRADPNLIYGVYRGQLQRSSDEGKTWDIVNTNLSNIVTLGTDATDRETIYAGTTSGLYVSQNKGNDWNKINIISGAVTAVAINPKDSQNIIIYADGQGLMKSADGGNTWVSLKGYSGNTVLQLDIDTQNPAVLYLINRTLEIHKTINSGETWKKVR